MESGITGINPLAILAEITARAGNATTISALVILSLFILSLGTLAYWVRKKRSETQGHYPNSVHSVILTLGIVAFASWVALVLNLIPFTANLDDATRGVFSSFFAWPVILYFGYLFTKSSLADVFPLKKVSMHYLPILTLMGLSFFICMVEFNSLFNTFLPLPNWVPDDFFERGTSLFLLVIVAAPFFEELMFRGLILRGLLLFHKPSVAIGVSALLFSLMHINPAQLLVALGCGALFGWVYYQTRSLLCTVGMHMLHNGVTYLLYISSYQEIRQTIAGPKDGLLNFTWWVGVLAISGFAWSLHLFNQKSALELRKISENEPVPIKRAA